VAESLLATVSAAALGWPYGGVGDLACFCAATGSEAEGSDDIFDPP